MNKDVVIIAAVAALALGCQPRSVVDCDFSKPFPLEADLSRSLQSRIDSEPVSDSLLVCDMETIGGWSTYGITTADLTAERSVDGGHSLRFCTPMRDTAFIKAHRTGWNSFAHVQNDSGLRLSFDEPRDWSQYSRISFRIYIHPWESCHNYLFCELHDEDYVPGTTTPRPRITVQDLKAGQWNYVVWEISNLKRDKVKSFDIFHTIIGSDPVEAVDFVADIDHLILEKAHVDHFEGWNVEPGRFAYSHLGYLPEAVKCAFHEDAAACDRFTIIDRKGRSVLESEAEHLVLEGGNFARLDFSSISKPGLYRIAYAGDTSAEFAVDLNVWLEAIHSSLNFFYCQRCGFDVPGYHGACHKDWFGFSGDEKKPIGYGWHDAGDLTEGWWRTAFGVWAMVSNIDNVELWPDLKKKLEEEAMWGAEYLIRTTFSDGKHISFAPQKFYSDNIPGNEDDNVTEAVMDPWENFLGAATLLYTMERIDGLTEEKREEMLQSATHIFTTAMASRDNWEEPRMKETAWGAIAATKLFNATSEQRYSRVAEHFGVKLLSFQQREAVRTADGTAVMGWFNDRQISGDINYSHSAAFESPLLAISILCKAFPESPLQMEWHAAAALYIDYLKKTTAILADKAPYGHLAHRILPTGKIPAEFGNSTAINDTLSLRSFPVWKSQMQHGENTCNLSQAWALAEAATLLGDREAMEMAGRQLEWVIGCNPFTQSLMYGVGNNFPNLYTLCTQNAVGALPVGIDSMHDDLPYWQSSAYACFKEIWVEPSSRFLGTLALYLKFMENQR